MFRRTTRTRTSASKQTTTSKRTVLVHSYVWGNLFTLHKIISVCTQKSPSDYETCAPAYFVLTTQHMLVNHSHSEPRGLCGLYAICYAPISLYKQTCLSYKRQEKVQLKKPKRFCPKRNPKHTHSFLKCFHRSEESLVNKQVNNNPQKTTSETPAGIMKFRNIDFPWDTRCGSGKKPINK